MSEKKTHWKETCDYKYLGAYSLAPSNEDIVVTITHVTFEEVTGENNRKEVCKIAHFKENIKSMILNKTNMKVIEKLYTGIIEEWINLRVEIGIQNVRSKGGEFVDALRIRHEIPSKDELKPDTETWGLAIGHIKNSGVTIAQIKEKYDLSGANEKLLIEESTIKPEAETDEA